MSNQRKALIKRVFDSIDKTGEGSVSIADIGKSFDPKNHPDVKAGRISATALLKSFFDSFSTVSDTGYVNLSQFIEYYANSAAFEDDIKFSENMQGVWNLNSKNTLVGPKPATLKSFSVNANSSDDIISDNSGYSKNLEKLRGQLRMRGARGFVGLQRKFKIMDDDGNGSLNLVEFKKAVRECGLSLTELQLSQLFQYFDKDRNGSVDFNEFLVATRVSPE